MSHTRPWRPAVAPAWPVVSGTPVLRRHRRRGGALARAGGGRSSSRRSLRIACHPPGRTKTPRYAPRMPFGRVGGRWDTVGGTRSPLAGAKQEGQQKTMPNQAGRATPAPRPSDAAPAEWTGLQVDGLVGRPLRLSAADLARLPQVRLTADFECLEGWTAPALPWEGAPLGALLERAG